MWFTSDPHFGHRRAAEHRGFATTDEHDQVIADNWRAAVKSDNDIVWVLGDLAMGNPNYALGLLAELPGRKRLVLGNHDPAHPLNHDAHCWIRQYFEVFEHVSTAATVKLSGIRVLLSHFPYERDRATPRHVQWRLRNEGRPLIHGHTHGRERLVEGVGSTELHVGVDAWDLKPVSAQQAFEAITGSARYSGA